MAILYTAEMTVSGITHGRRRGYIKYSVSTSSSATTVTVSEIGVAYYTNQYAGTYTYTTTGTVSATCGGTSLGSASKSQGSVYCTTEYKLIPWSTTSTSVSFTRTSSAQTKTLQVSFAYSGGSPNPATDSISITVPAIAAQTYYLNYDANGGYAEPTSEPYTSQDPGTVNAYNQPARMGYQFKYWTSNQNGTGTIYYPGDTYSVTGGGTIYAQWAPAICIAPTRKFIYIEDGESEGEVTTKATGGWYPVDTVYVYDGSKWSQAEYTSRLYDGSTWLYT